MLIRFTFCEGIKNKLTTRAPPPKKTNPNQQKTNRILYFFFWMIIPDPHIGAFWINHLISFWSIECLWEVAWDPAVPYKTNIPNASLFSNSLRFLLAGLFLHDKAFCTHYLTIHSTTSLVIWLKDNLKPLGRIGD